ncbi:MAG TPA: hypothetical protein VFX28_25630, partial [Methylomirabilota bacterium]|nr:hypothetical protein [Methylomirabilota bacterium]
IRGALAATERFVTLDERVVKMSATREVVRAMFLGDYDARRKAFSLVRWERDPALLDPVPWDKYYR